MENIERIYHKYDRIKNNEKIKELINLIYLSTGINFSCSGFILGFTTPEYEKLTANVKNKILELFLKMNFSFRHYILCFAREIIENKNSGDIRLIKLQMKRELKRGIIDVYKTKYDSNSSIIELSTIQGNYTIIPAIDYLSRNEYNLEKSSTFGMCFTNSIDLLENLKKGKICFMQLDSGNTKFLHAVYIDNSNMVIDLNYLTVISYEDFIELYNPNILMEVSFEVWENLKQQKKYNKKESLLVTYCIFNGSLSTENEGVREQDFINYLDCNDGFAYKKR